MEPYVAMIRSHDSRPTHTTGHQQISPCRAVLREVMEGFADGCHLEHDNSRLRSLRLSTRIGRSSVLVVMVFMLFGGHLLGPDYLSGPDMSRRKDGTAQTELRLLCGFESCIPESFADQLEETPAWCLHFIQHNLITIK